MDQQRLRRVFDVLGLLARNGTATVTEASRELGLPLSSAHDLLRSMTQMGAVSEQQKAYTLGPRAVRLAFEVVDSIGVQRVAQPHLKRLAQTSGLDTYLAVRSGPAVMYASRHPGAQAVNIDIPLGRPLYLHSTAVGKLFAALDRDMYQTMVNAPRPALTPRTRTNVEQLDRDLRTIRSRGLSVSRGESVPGILGVAAPVWAPDERLVAAVHLSILQASISTGRLKEIGEFVQQTASAVEDELTDRLGATA